MTKKIFRNILLVGLTVLLLSSALMISVLERHFTQRVFAELTTEAALAVQGVTLTGRTYLEELDDPHRITWIDREGHVLYDSIASTDSMENHLSREEIQEALSVGEGRSNRYSSTLSSQTLYVALPLEDGTVLRVASEQSSVFSLLQELLPSVLLILGITAALAILMAHRLSHSIIRPILDLDLLRPEKHETYEELAPLLQELRRQKTTIRNQMDALQRQHEEFTAITENMSEGFLLIDSQTNLLSCNTSAMQLLGAADMERGKSVLPVSRAEPFRRVVNDALSGRHSEALLEQDGKCYQLLASGVSRGGRIVGAVIAILDVTERESREVLRREFTANVSHELKTPLTSISGFAELMKSGTVPPEISAEFAGDIYREAQRLITLVEDIIHLSQLDEGAVSTESSPVDLREMSRQVLDRLTSAAEKAGVTLHLEGSPATVTAVAHIVDELIFNLADNAIKYNRPGGTVTVSVGLLDGKARLSVADTGIGIPAADQQRVFERFYRVDKSHSKEVGGTGLGLSIVKHAAAFLGAELTLQSTEGAGTTITVQWK